MQVQRQTQYVNERLNLKTTSIQLDTTLTDYAHVEMCRERYRNFET